MAAKRSAGTSTTTTKKAAAASAVTGKAPELIDQLARVLRRHGLTELEYEDRDVRVVLRRGATAQPAVSAPVEVPTVEAFPMTPGLKPAPMTGRGIAPRAVTAEADSDPSEAFITAPLVGTFYRAPSPTAPVFAEVGTTLRKGQVVCIVEAMKLMNQIEAEFPCTVLDVLVQNGEPVEYGQRLFRVRKAG